MKYLKWLYWASFISLIAFILYFKEGFYSIYNLTINKKIEINNNVIFINENLQPVYILKQGLFVKFRNWWPISMNYDDGKNTEVLLIDKQNKPLIITYTPELSNLINQSCFKNNCEEQLISLENTTIKCFNIKEIGCADVAAGLIYREYNKFSTLKYLTIKINNEI